MIKIKRIYEFLEFGKSYPCKFVEKKGNYYVYSFDSMNDVYMVQISVWKEYERYRENYVSFEWCNEKDFYEPNRSKFIDQKTGKDVNFNDLFKILNTIFKIMFEFMDKNKIRCGKIGSKNKNKYRMYKKIIEEEQNCKIIESSPSFHILSSGIKMFPDYYRLFFVRKDIGTTENDERKPSEMIG